MRMIKCIEELAAENQVHLPGDFRGLDVGQVKVAIRAMLEQTIVPSGSKTTAGIPVALEKRSLSSCTFAAFIRSEKLWFMPEVLERAAYTI